MDKILLIIVTIFAISNNITLINAIVRKWHCNDKNFCEPILSTHVNFYANTSLHQTQELCRLVCGKSRSLWPVPYEIVDLSDNYITFSIDKLNFDFKDVPETLQPMLDKMTKVFSTNLRIYNKINYKSLRVVSEEELDGRELSIIFKVESSSHTLDWNTNEEYVLDLKSATSKKILAEIDASTVYGARHALETLSQLIVFSSVTSQEKTNLLVILSKALIKDKPLYKHRGLLLDTSRNFLPLKQIRQTISAMAASKLNVFHWHLTDAQSFPLEISKYPKMSEYGSYSNEKIYRLSDIRHIITYAKIRGIRVLLEIDAPAHAGFGWQWGAENGLGDLAVCVNKQPWRSYCIQPPCGQLNPVNPNVAVVMKEIYKDLIKVNSGELNFHMGGDEVHLGCWNSTKEIVDAMLIKGYNRTKDGFMHLWSDFQQSMLDVYDSLIENNNSKVILWSSDLTNPKYISKFLSPDRYVIQTWVEKENSLNKELLEQGYQLIISTKNAWYFDHGFWGSTQYYGWKKVYGNKILADEDVLGGEGCMWGEFVDQNSLHSKIWPRAAALAERLWSDPIDADYDEIETRLNAHTKRITALGLTPDALRPEWCLINEGNCPNYH